ncbi:polymorphic toxin type 44 domain-containing protein [Elizabethkingia anophelis]|uniref:polymorphic toxin type 44 domain-containing protein n=1 Tax=Elizabethkingia anophelis TaxID=1117645 RepID=UPI0013705A7C|nr:polymorphic toxin type 44 domain-containing protein [Elizabethkingia anophelis]MYY44009.1 hypothetical protein [Elizabethkingia anophelis]
MQITDIQIPVKKKDNLHNATNTVNINHDDIDIPWDSIPDTPYGTIGNLPFHDTQGQVEVDSNGQLQFSLPIALPPGIKSIAPQIHLVYGSSSGNGIAGYGWNLSGVTSISRMGKTIEKDGEVKGIQLDYSDYYQLNGQRLILVSGEYGRDGAEYATEKYSNIKVKSVGVNSQQNGPLYFEINYEDGSQAWYGHTPEGESVWENGATTPIEYNIVKWIDAQGNYITYNYTQQNYVALLYSITWGGNEKKGTTYFNSIVFNYITRDMPEISYIKGRKFVQTSLLSNLVIYTNNSQFKKYIINYTYNATSKYQFVESIQELNSKNERAVPISFTYENDVAKNGSRKDGNRFDDIYGKNVISGDFTGNGKLDFLNGKSLMLDRLDGNKNVLNISYEGIAMIAGMAMNKDNILLTKQALFTQEISYEKKTLTIRVYEFIEEAFQIINVMVYDLSAYPKLFEKSSANLFIPELNVSAREGDFDGDGISEFILHITDTDVYALDERYEIIHDQHAFYLNIEKNVFKEMIGNEFFPTNTRELIKHEESNCYPGNFVETGKTDLLVVTKTDLNIYRLDADYNFVKIFSENKLSELKNVFLGDFTGDGKTDLMIPNAEDSSDWTMYISTGNGFIAHSYPGFWIYKPYLHHDTHRSTEIYRYYFTPDLNKDGKSDFLIFESEKWYRDYDINNPDSTYGLFYFRNDGVDSAGKPIFVVGYRLDRDHRETNEETINYSMYGEHYIPLIGNFRIAQTNTELSITHKTTFITWDFGNKLDVISRIKGIQQGEIYTEVQYAPATKENDVYISDSFMQYPYVNIRENYSQYFVSQLSQEGRKQNFKYRNLIGHLQGRGIIGFREIARSSWYADGYENTTIWSGIKIDPTNEGLPVKEWSVRTIDNDLIFPLDISLDNNQLLTFKSTEYKTDKTLMGISAIVPIKTVTKDYVKNITEETDIVYDTYYLPEQTTTKINNDFANTTTTIVYIHNPEGTGSNYFIGRPVSKTEVVFAYGDIKSVVEEYTYENNLVKTFKNYNRDHSGWIQEKYSYDNFGNITEKIISNSVDEMIQISKSEYDTKGRFVIKKTDNLGLETFLTYNDWGQVISMIEPLNIITENSYDAWGKLLISKINTGGTSTYTYEKFTDGGNKVTSYAPDGTPKEVYTNKLGQQYKVRTRGFNREGYIVFGDDFDVWIEDGVNSYISINTEYDILGRKFKESEPYLGMSPVFWNTMEYDDSVFPPTVTSTSFNGKQVKTSIIGRENIIEELNGYQRTTKKVTDALENVINSEDSGGVISFSYNAAGDQITAQYDSNIVITEYDVWGRKYLFHDPSNGEYFYEYNGFGQVTKEVSPKGYKQYTYNEKGQLINQTEKSNAEELTNKSIDFSYNTQGLLISKTGISDGKNYSTFITYDPHGRLLEKNENSNSRTYIQKEVIYDNISRVVSYVKEINSGNISTQTSIENIYDKWTGLLFQIKDKTKGDTLWKLQETDARGQVIRSRLGASSIANAYDINNSLTQIKHISGKGILLESQYTFDAVRNELKERKRQGTFALHEMFTYDGNNRLIQWTNPKTKKRSSNTYDAKGRITGNDQLGIVQFGNSPKVYQASGVKLNMIGKQNYLNAPIQRIVYNENNNPVFIHSKNSDVRFSYGLTDMRQMVTYGGVAEAIELYFGGVSNYISSNWEGGFTKYYSEDGSFEVVRNNITREEKHLLYIGGTPYESNIVFVKDYDEDDGSYKFLHKDYLGSILAISDEEGRLIEESHFDAWGVSTGWRKLGNPLDMAKEERLLNRGYTSHEHFEDTGIIHMNGRLYDPLLRRFLNADPYIQDPYNTQIYNKYGYVMNNPLLYNDPSGKLFGIDDLFLIGLGIAALFSIGMDFYYNRPISLGNLLQSLTMAAIAGGMSYGVGSIFKAAGGLLKTVGRLGFEMIRAVAHGVSQGLLSAATGGNFARSFLSSAVASLGGFGADRYLGGSFGMQAAAGIILGGVTSELAGGNFWIGAGQGLIVTIFNHFGHRDEVEGPGPKVKKDLTREFDIQAKETNDFFSKRKAYYDKQISDLKNSIYSTKEMYDTVEYARLKEFYDLVKSGGPYDLKQKKKSNFSYKKLGREVSAIYNGQAFGAEDFGNYNFGIAAKAYGFSLNFARAGAGLYQIYSFTSNIKWISTYFDDPRDSMMIKRGYYHFK